MPQSVERTAQQILELLTGAAQGAGAQSLEASFEAIRDALGGLDVGAGGGGGDAGALTLRRQPFTIDNAGVLALPTVAQTIVAAVPGHHIIPVAITVRSTIVAPYTDLEDGYLVATAEELSEAGGIERADLSSALTATLLTATTTAGLKVFASFFPAISSPLWLFASNNLAANFTGGNAGNALEGEVHYYLIPTAAS